MDRSISQRGSAIFMIFVAVALFGALGYAFLQGTRGSTSLMTGEAAKAKATQLQECANTVNAAVKRLKLGDCASYISYNTDGSNTLPGAPTDGSCSVYHIKGGGVKPCELPPAPADCPNPGDACSDGRIYVDSLSGVKLFTTSSDAGSTSWNNGNTNWGAHTATGATSASDGLANTNTLVAISDSFSPYQAAAMCRALGPAWYLPSRNELDLLYTNRTLGALNGSYTGCYSSSSETSASGVYIKDFSSGTGQMGAFKYNVCKIRCFSR